MPAKRGCGGAEKTFGRFSPPEQTSVKNFEEAGKMA